MEGRVGEGGETEEGIPSATHPPVPLKRSVTEIGGCDERSTASHTYAPLQTPRDPKAGMVSRVGVARGLPDMSSASCAVEASPRDTAGAGNMGRRRVPHAQG